MSEDNDVNVSFEMSDVVRPSMIEKMLPYALGLIAMIVVVMMFAGMQNAGSGGGSMMNFGKSRAKMTNDGDNKITFNEVAGLKEEKEDLEEIVDFLKEIKKLDGGAKVIMCSAMGQQAMVIESIQAGAKDFIVKPFQAERVIEAVKKVVG